MSNNSEIERATLNINELDKVIQYYMSRIADVDIEGKLAPDDFVDTFRTAFGFADHNYLAKNTKGILCYDLMICKNPLEDKPEQMFYTFFSQKEVFKKKKLLAGVYTHYLENHKEHNIDTMLQICYSRKKEETNYAKVKEGFYLEFNDNNCCLKTLPDENELSSFDIVKKIKDELKESKIRKIEKYYDYLEKKISGEELYSKDSEVTKFASLTDAFLGEESNNDNLDPLTAKEIHQNAYRVSLINELAVPGIKRLYFIPVSFPGGKQIGHFVLSTTGKEDVKKEKEIIDKFKVLSFVLLFPLSQCHLSSIYINKARVESVKAAKAAIMSRNMSHNLGSHVMFYIKQKLESVEKILQTGTLQELIKSSSVAEMREKLQEGKAELGDELPFLVGLGRFLNYLQERQDFIATVATNYIPYTTTINFKDAIYDELKPEKRAQRHNRDMNGKKAANLLLDYIAYSEGFKSSDYIELCFGDDFDGGGEPKDVPKDLRKFNVALPGGNLGRQAFFSIMENIIRNTAKHDCDKINNGMLRFQFDILDSSKINNIESYSLRQGENRDTNNFDVSCYKTFENDFLYLGITIKLKEEVLPNTLKTISKGLRQSYLTSDGQMDEECKGLKEIRISAAWLRRQELDDEISQDEPPAVAIRKNDGHLQYILCLSKPHEIAFILSSKSDNQKTLEEIGDIFKVEEINDTSIKKIANYEYIVLDDDKVALKTYQLLKKNVGTRIFWSKTNKITSPSQIYDEWLKESKLNDTNPTPIISILDGDKVATKFIGEDKNKKILESGTSEKGKVYFENSIVFFRHYSGQHAYNKKDRKILGQARFIESISGGNSTYRLVRQDEPNDKWFDKQVAASLTKIAIFDERLYNLIMPEGVYEPTKIHECIKDFLTNNYAQKKGIINWSALTNTLEIGPGSARPIINELKDQKKKLKEDEIETILSKHLNIKNYARAWQYRETGIWGFNIRVEDNEKEGNTDKKVILLGYNAPTTKRIGEFQDSYQELEIAVIQKNGKEIAITKSNNFPKPFEFDFITIHQGILDKIYNALKIDKSDSGKKEREKLTKNLYNLFSKNNPCGTFLPQFIIHSGRSKPNIGDMPQKQPFLQFSALDHALRDCKYTLVELLNSAHYE